MKWSWKIGEFAGIGLFVHATFPLLLAFVALPALINDGDVVGALESVAFVLVLFLCVVLHEYGHALAARRYGIKTQDITLLPIGGVARLERMPEKPTQELVVAAAGPLVNVAIAGVLFIVMTLTGTRIPALGLGSGDEAFIAQLFIINMVLVLFNLIPAFPMDGGRILRALLATRMDYAQATKYAAWLGQGIAVIFAIGGFILNPLLILTATFIFAGARAESQMVQQRSKMNGFTAGQAMRTNVRALSSYEGLASAMDSMMSTAQHDFPIVDNGRVVGMLTREALLKGLNQLGAYVPISNVMRRDVPSVDAAQSLAGAAEIMQANALAAVPVTNNGMLVGMLTFDSLREFLVLQKVLQSHPRAAGEIRMV